MIRTILTVVFGITFSIQLSAQGSDCASSQPLCTGTTYQFPASTSTTAETGPDYGCLFSQPNPAWYYLQIDQSGSITITLDNTQNEDIDFICWGPFTSMSTACNNLTANQSDDCYFFETYPCGNIVDCSFSTDAQEFCDIPNALSGQIYVLLITNYSGVPTDIIAQGTGTATTDCSIVTPCDILTLTGTPGACDANNNYTLSGTFSYTNNPGAGTLTITVNNGSNTFTQTFNPPFTDNQVFNYSIPNIPGNGANTTVTATFSAEGTCTQSINYTAPSCSSTSCAITQLTGVPSDCDASYNYTMSGNVVFQNNPGAGTLVITVDNGTNTYTQSFSPPFVDGQNYPYSIPNIPGNGAATSVTAAFTNDPGCSMTVNTTAPVCVCTFTSGNYQMSPCDADSNFTFSGTLTFGESPSTGTLTVAISTASGTYTQTFNAPFTDNVPLAFSISGIPADNSPATAGAAFSDNLNCVYNFGAMTTPECICEITADFLPSPQVLYLPATTAQMVNTSSNGNSYFWNFGDGFTSTMTNPAHTYSADSAGVYLVTLIAESLQGCRDTVSKYVTIKEQLIYYVPNAFTPDGDEFNQTFGPVFLEGYDPFAFQFLVFNRYGEIIFESLNADEGWDGTYHGAVVPEGLYTWKITYKLLENDSHHEVHGHVAVLR